jgi:hypothetical protein
MGCARYKLFFNDIVATAKQLASFETITVHQEMDHFWSASLEVPLCLDAKGNWSGESESWFQPENRLRVEVSMQGKGFVPLIDGPIVTCHYDMHMEPGKSIAHVEVHDDGHLLHRDEKVKVYPTDTDDKIAQKIFCDNRDIIKSTKIDPIPPTNNLSSSFTVLRGTSMGLLQKLAGRQDKTWHAFILPGPLPHTSIGCFQKDQTSDSGLPNMVLLGRGQNVLNVRPTGTSATVAVFRGAAISLSDGSTDNRTANLSDIQRLGTNPPPGTPMQRMLPPGASRNVNVQNKVLSASKKAAYALHAEGEVMKDTYPAVLRPYQTVQLLGVNGKFSGQWLVRQVTHTLTRNSYGQTFELQRDAESAGTGAGSKAPAVKVFS